MPLRSLQTSFKISIFFSLSGSISHSWINIFLDQHRLNNLEYFWPKNNTNIWIQDELEKDKNTMQNHPTNLVFWLEMICVAQNLSELSISIHLVALISKPLRHHNNYVIHVVSNALESVARHSFKLDDALYSSELLISLNQYRIERRKKRRRRKRLQSQVKHAKYI